MPQIEISEELTNSRWIIPAMPDITAAIPWQPGIYTVLNEAGGNVTFTIFRQLYTMVNTTKWRFKIHENVASADLIGGAPALGFMLHYGN